MGKRDLGTDLGVGLPPSPASSAHRGLRIALAGGGTGGHLVPGLHLLEWALAQGQAPEHVLWFTAGRPVEARVLQDLESRLPGVLVDQVVLPLEGAQGGAPTTLALLRRSPRAYGLARRSLLRFGSQVLLGLGGFTALPSVLAARRLRIPVALYEVNTVAGRATKRLAPLAREVLHAWPDSIKHPSKNHSRHRAIGPVVAPSFQPMAAGGDAGALRTRLGLTPERPMLCILGGSQGAGALNHFVAQHAAAWIAAGWQVLHQVGPGRSQEAGPAHEHYQVREYLQDMPAVLQAADLVLGRGGASSLAEIGAACVPSWIVPYPHHADRHQWRNAARLQAGTRIIPETELNSAVATEIAHLASEPLGPVLRPMREALLQGRMASGAGQLWQSLERLAAQARVPHVH